MRSKAFHRIIGTANVLLLVALVWLLATSDRMKTWYQEVSPQNHETSLPDYRSNPHYADRVRFLEAETGPYRMVMLGTSLTFLVSWNELLGRCDISNQGIRSDISTGIAARVQQVLRMKPAICFIEAGVNDIATGVPADTTMKALQETVQHMQQQGVIPVMHTVARVCDFYPDSTINRKANLLNNRIRKAATDWQVGLIDLDKRSDSTGFLPHKYALSDGCHFSYEMYQLWAEEIKRILAEKRI